MVPTIERRGTGIHSWPSNAPQARQVSEQQQ